MNSPGSRMPREYNARTIGALCGFSLPAAIMMRSDLAGIGILVFLDCCQHIVTQGQVLHQDMVSHLDKQPDANARPSQQAKLLLN